VVFQFVFPTWEEWFRALLWSGGRPTIWFFDWWQRGDLQVHNLYSEGYPHLKLCGLAFHMVDGKEANYVQRQIIWRTLSIKMTDNGIGRHWVQCVSWSHDRIRQQHPRRVRNVPSSWTRMQYYQMDLTTQPTHFMFHVSHSHRSLGRWCVQSHAHNSCGLGQWQQRWQSIDLATSLFTFFSIWYFLLRLNRLNIVSDDFTHTYS
jgi:hypothetical protein